MRIHTLYKRFATLALAILTLGVQADLYALGMGEIQVQSNLGQPLRAKIKLFGASDIKDPSCFRVGTPSDGSNAINHARFKISNISGDNATLTVTTTEVITEPIANLSIISDCAGNYQRDYVLLIDPAPTEAPSNAFETEEAPIAPAGKTKRGKSRSANFNASGEEADASMQFETSDQAQLESSAPPVKKQKLRKKRLKKNKSTTTDKALMAEEAVSRSAPPTTALAPKEMVNTTKPSLTISRSSESLSGLTNLRIDRQLNLSADPSPMPADPSLLSDIEMQDDVTAMTNRLANLEAQITKLQQNNRALTAENKVKTQQLEESSANKNWLQWLYYAIGGGLLLAGGYFAANYWRNKDKPSEVLWDDAPNKANDFDEIFDAKVKKRVVVAEEPASFFDDEPSQESIIADEKTTFIENIFDPVQPSEDPFIVDGENYEFSILDHADVFLSHGRTTLAIQLLQNHLLDFPKKSVTVWLFLLDLLTKEKLQAVYEQTKIDCKEHFNIKISDYSETEIASKESLESFPHLTEGLQEVWNTPAAIVYLDDLIYNNRLEARAGFDKNFIEDLIALKAVAQENLKTADVIQLDEKKLAMKELKEAQIAAHKAEKIEKLSEEAPFLEELKTETVAEEPLSTFEFKLAD